MLESVLSDCTVMLTMFEDHGSWTPYHIRVLNWLQFGAGAGTGSLT